MTLMHQCSGSECSFCAWRKDNPIELGWERLLEDSELLNGGSTVCGVNLTCSQVENPDRELSTQQTADFLSRIDDDCLFPKLDYDLSKFCPSMTPILALALWLILLVLTLLISSRHLVSQPPLQVQLHLLRSLLHACMLHQKDIRQWRLPKIRLIGLFACGQTGNLRH